ncbi:MAG TPA: hypothetical protein VK941_12675 [Gillisia sp.]|nr:hypothetical protein [Gillisia sp.]
MKFAIFIYPLVSLLLSCSTETGKVESPLSVTGEWVLVEMAGSLVGSTTSGEEMHWQEKYLLKPDGTFIKTRVTGDEVIKAEGTYITDSNNPDVQNDPQLELTVQFTYSEKNEIIGSCMPASLKEYMFIYRDQKMRSTWNACDGPSLDYERGR